MCSAHCAHRQPELACCLPQISAQADVLLVDDCSLTCVMSVGMPAKCNLRRAVLVAAYLVLANLLHSRVLDAD